MHPRKAKARKAKTRMMKRMKMKTRMFKKRDYNQTKFVELQHTDKCSVVVFYAFKLFIQSQKNITDFLKRLDSKFRTMNKIVGNQ